MKISHLLNSGRLIWIDISLSGFSLLMKYFAISHCCDSCNKYYFILYIQGFKQNFSLKWGVGGILSSRKKQFIYIIWSSHDRENVKQISDETKNV